MRVGALLSCCLLSTITILLISCNSDSQSNIEPSDLLIDLSTMPSNWYMVSTSQEPPSDYFHYESGADIWFNGNTNKDLIVAAHRVYQLKSESRAAKAFEHLLSVEFNNQSAVSVTPWKTPSELPYHSAVADRFHFACHIADMNGKSEICEAIGQYDNYLVIFHTHITPGYMTYQDLSTILKSIDERMANYVTTNISEDG